MLGTSFTTNVRLGRAALVAWALSLALSLLGPKIRVRYRERNDYYAA